jgi:hypothetical protein
MMMVLPTVVVTLRGDAEKERGKKEGLRGRNEHWGRRRVEGRKSASDLLEKRDLFLCLLPTDPAAEVEEHERNVKRH